MEAFQVNILAADRPFYEGPCESLTVPTNTGLFGVLAHHCNVICAIVPGILRYQLPGEPARFAAVSAGLMKVENNRVLVLVDTAERPEDIDANRARRAADEAKEAMLQKRSIQEYHSAQAQLARAVSRLRVKDRQTRAQSK